MLNNLNILLSPTTESISYLICHLIDLDKIYLNELSTVTTAVLVIPKYKDTASCLRMCSNLHFRHNNGGLPR